MNTLEARRRLLGRNVYKRTTEGNPAIAQGSLARRYLGITMQGWTEQDSTTGAQLLPSVIDGLLTDNSGSVSANNLFKTIWIELDIGTYSFSSSEKLYIVRKCINGSNLQNITDTLLIGSPYVVEVTQKSYLGLSFRKFDSTEFTGNEEFMLNSGSTALPWEPYTGGQPSPNPDYPQPITSAGNWNEKTQKWEYEITIANEQTDPDKNQTVTLTSDRPLTKWDRLEKRNGQWGWVYKSEEIESYTDESVPGEYFSTTGRLSTGAQVWYETTTETFVPLSESEQEQMNALHTFRPTTVLSNDCGCNMTLTYKTKKSLEVTD